jgi:hypothetical protein
LEGIVSQSESGGLTHCEVNVFHGSGFFGFGF